MKGYVESPCVQWSGMDIENHLEGRLDLERVMFLHENFKKFHDYLDGIMECVLEDYEDEIIEFINGKIAIYIEDELAQIKKEIDEYREE
jgi:hypothetical protein